MQRGSSTSFVQVSRDLILECLPDSSSTSDTVTYECTTQNTLIQFADYYTCNMYNNSYIVVVFHLYSHVWVGGGFRGDFILSATWNAQWRKSADLEGLLGSKNLFLQWSLQMSDKLEIIYMCSILSQYVEFTQTKLLYNFPLDRSFFYCFRKWSACLTVDMSVIWVYVTWTNPRWKNFTVGHG